MASGGKQTKTYGITLDIAQRHLDEWLEAELNVTTHQSYTLGSRTLTLADLDMIREEIEYWDDKVEALKAEEKNGGKRGRAYRIIHRDL